MTRATEILLLASALTVVAAPARAAGGGLGTSCASAADCTSQRCVDGVCCEDSACGDCGRCDHPDHRGECFAREPGFEGAGCVDGYVCSGTHLDCKRDCAAGPCASGYYCTDDVTPVCRKQLPVSSPCASACPAGGACSACESGYCVDGVCCDARCDGECVACTEALKGQGQNGYCDSVAAGKPGRQRCDYDPAPSCMRTSACDGKGACALYPPGTRCGENLCVKDLKVDLECDGQGQCAPHISKECRGECASDAGCEQPVCKGEACDAGPTCAGASCDAGTCDGGACARRPTLPCASDTDCTAPLRCDFDGRCLDPRELIDSPSACAVGRSGSRREGTLAWALLCLAGLSLLRQRSARPFR